MRGEEWRCEKGEGVTVRGRGVRMGRERGENWKKDGVEQRRNSEDVSRDVRASQERLVLPGEREKQTDEERRGECGVGGGSVEMKGTVAKEGRRERVKLIFDSYSLENNYTFISISFTFPPIINYTLS